MQKLLNIAAAVLASTMLFVGCSNGSAAPAEPEYQDLAADLAGQDLDLGTAWSNTVSVKGSAELSMLSSGAKISVAFKVTDAASYHMIKCVYNNLYDDAGENVLKGWEDYQGKYYDAEGNELAIDNGYIRPTEDGVIIIKPTDTQIAAFKKRGLIIQGYATAIESVTVSYIGKKFIRTDVNDFANITGTVGGKSKLMLDPENANVTILGLEDIQNNESQTIEYSFSEPADLTGLKGVKFSLRTGYYLKADTGTGAVTDSEADTGTGDISKVSTFKNGNYVKLAPTYNRYCVEPDAEGHLVNSYGDKTKKLSLYDIMTNKDFVKTGVIPDESLLPENAKEIYPYADLAVEALYTESNDNRWQEHFIYLEGNIEAKTNPENSKYSYGPAWAAKPITITLITDDNNSSSYTFYSKDGDAYTDKPFSGEYADYPFKFSDFTEKAPDTVNKDGKVTKEGKAVNLKKVKGIKITTNGSEGDLYIKAINFTF